MRLIPLVLALSLFAVPATLAQNVTDDPDDRVEHADVTAYGTPHDHARAAASAQAPGDAKATAGTEVQHDSEHDRTKAGAHGALPVADRDGVYAVHRSDGTLVVYRETNGCPGLQYRTSEDCHGADERVRSQPPPEVPSPDVPGVPVPDPPADPGTPQPPSTPDVPDAPGAPDPGDPPLPDWIPSDPVGTVVTIVEDVLPGLGSIPDPDPGTPTPPDPSPGTPDPEPPSPPDPDTPEVPDDPGTPDPGDPLPDVPGADDVFGLINDVISDLPIPPL